MPEGKEDVNSGQSNLSEGTPTINVRNASPNDSSKNIEHCKFTSCNLD